MASVLQTTQRNTNPFAASSFKGNVLTADVFESSAKQKEPAFTGKLKASALVGSISGIGEKFQSIVDSVVAFGVRVKENVVNGWNKLEGIEISFNPLKERMISAYNKYIKEPMNTPLSELFSSGISSREIAKMEDLSIARSLLSENVALWEAAI